MKKSFKVNTEIIPIDKTFELISELKIKDDDLIVVSQMFFSKNLQDFIKNSKCKILIKDDFYKIQNDILNVRKVIESIDFSYKRVIGIGSASIMDLAKLLSLNDINNFDLILQNKIKRHKELLLVPTTPGIGSEVSPFLFLNTKDLHNIVLLNNIALCADITYICYEALEQISDNALLSSTFDAFTQAFETYLSPYSTCINRAICKDALKIFTEILLDFSKNENYVDKNEILKKCIFAGTMSGIAYANIGSSIVQNLAYPLRSCLNIRNGLACYVIFFEVLKIYDNKKPYGLLDDLKDIIAIALQCPKERAFYELERMCNFIYKKQSLSSLGMKDNQILEFTDLVMTNVDFFDKNSYVDLSLNEIADLYKRLF